MAVRLKEGGENVSLLELEHSGFGVGEQWDATFEYFTNAWPRVLAGLEATVSIKN